METGGKAALPIFREIVLKVYQAELFGPAPRFPAEMEDNINAYLMRDLPPKQEAAFLNSLRVPRFAGGEAKGCPVKLVLQSTYRCEPASDQRYTIYATRNERGQLIFASE